MHGRRDPPHSVTAATRRIRHALALAVFASLSAGVPVAQGASEPGLTPAAQQMARHFQHEDMIDGGRQQITSAPSSAEMMARHFQHEDALYQLSERAASFPTPQGLRADGLRWQGIAKTYMQLQGAGIEPTWEHQLHSPGAVSRYPTPAGLKADGLRWQGIARAYGLVNGERLASTGTGGGFDWGTAGIGFATAIVAMLLAGAGAIARRRTLTKRRGAVAAARP
jgi:hypothetical protein